MPTCALAGKSYPGRYLLKMTLPQGLESGTLAAMHDRIRRLLETGGRRDHDEAAVLRLDPLVLAAGDADAQPDAVAAARVRPRGTSGRHHRGRRRVRDGGARRPRRRGGGRHPPPPVRHRAHAADRRRGPASWRCSSTTPTAASGADCATGWNWRARRGSSLPHKAARPVIAVTCASRFELFGIGRCR